MYAHMHTHIQRSIEISIERSCKKHGKVGWRCGSSVRVASLQARSPEFKTLALQNKERKNDKVNGGNFKQFISLVDMWNSLCYSCNFSVNL
jgi:hypothetical protein